MQQKICTIINMIDEMKNDSNKSAFANKGDEIMLTQHK